MTKLPTVDIKGKKYVVVNERLKFFRENYPNYSLETEIVEVNEDTALMRAVIRNEENRIMATGVSFEKSGDGFINKTSHVENCETSAWGRALANFGIGIDETVASADEVVNAINSTPKEKKPPTVEKVMEVLNNCKDHKALDIAMGQAKKYLWTPEQLKMIEECKLNVSTRLSNE